MFSRYQSEINYGTELETCSTMHVVPGRMTITVADGVACALVAATSIPTHNLFVLIPVQLFITYLLIVLHVFMLLFLNRKHP